MDSEIANLVEVLHHVDCDNASLQYVGRRPHRTVSQMPLTSFVYEFFIYNGIYQVDWENTREEGRLAYHPRSMREEECQRALWSLLADFARREPASLYRAFEPLAACPAVEGSWTKITPDGRIGREEGERFFKVISGLQGLIEACDRPEELAVTDSLLESIDEARGFVYRVRNNIFHGSKTLGEIHEPGQRRRIEIYDMFLKGINSLFFLKWRRDPVASDLVQGPVLFRNAEKGEGETVVLEQNAVWDAINRGVMKMGDPRLILEFRKAVSLPATPPKEGSALFYPSAGTDFLTPLLLGLPWCTEFYFYERNRRIGPGRLQGPLRRVAALTGVGRVVEEPEESRYRVDFVYEGIPRTVFVVHRDNEDFLNSGVNLGFYFHRGDGSGEGGSGQSWDSELLPGLLRMIPHGHRCPFLSDGIPGGFGPALIGASTELGIWGLHEQRWNYRIGVLVA